MVWDSDSDDGEMKGGSDVEIAEHVSRFFCKNYCFHRVTKKVKVGCQCHRFSIDWAGLWPFDVHRFHHLCYFYTHVIYCYWHYLDVWHSSTIQWLVWITKNYTLFSMAMLNTTFVKFWQLSVSSSFCLDVLHFCSVDVTSNLSHQLLCFIMLSYFIIVYNYISLISCLFILTLFYYRKKKRRKRILFSSTSISHKTHILYHFKQLKTTQI